MATRWGVARFRLHGRLDYFLLTGGWLPDSQLVDGAKLFLVESAEQAERFARKLPIHGDPHGVEVEVDCRGAVLAVGRR